MGDQKHYLIQEPEKYLKKRKGGVVNLILTALLVEATRQLDEGFDISSIENAAKDVFHISKGFLTKMDELGIVETIKYMEYLSDSSDPDDPLFKVFFNFFSPGRGCQNIMKQYQEAADKSSVKWVTTDDLEKKPANFLFVELLKKRFLAVVFTVASDIAGAGFIDPLEVDDLCKKLLGWAAGPFSMMNDMGIREVMRIVTERMELSHRNEINFPISRLLIEQAQKDELWPLENRS